MSLSKRLFFPLVVSFALSSLVAACAAPAVSDDSESSEQSQVSDIARMTARGDGTFDVECRDGQKEIVSAEDVSSGRVCKPQAWPGSPFDAEACTGTPITEAVAKAKLGRRKSATVGTYVLALRHRNADYRWERNRWEAHYTWVDAPKDALVAWRETGMTSTTGEQARFTTRGTIELARDDKGVYLRMVGEAANVVGPDTTRFVRLVSKPMRPWAEVGRSTPDFALEVREGESKTWSPQTEWGWSVQVVVAGSARTGQWWFEGADTTKIVTSQCGQFVSVQNLSSLSPINSAIGIYMQLN